MENQDIFKTPNKILARMQVVHLGKILFNLQFVVLSIMLASILTFIMPALYYLVLVCITFLSFFTLLANPTFISFWKGGEHLSNIATIMSQSWKYTVPILAVLSLSAIVCLLFDKNKKQVARIVISVIILIISLIVLIAKLLNSGVA